MKGKISRNGKRTRLIRPSGRVCACAECGKSVLARTENRAVFAAPVRRPKAFVMRYDNEGEKLYDELY